MRKRFLLGLCDVLFRLGCCVFAVAAMWCVAHMFGLLPIKNYKYTPSDIYYSNEAWNAVYDVEVMGIRNEEEEEAVYEIRCGDASDPAYDLTVSLPASDFEAFIGSENNSVSGEVYRLRLAVYIENPLIADEFYITFMRYSFLGESDFSEEEIAQIVQKYAQACTARGKTGTGDYWMIVEQYAPHTPDMAVYSMPAAHESGKDNMTRVEEGRAWKSESEK